MTYRYFMESVQPFQRKKFISNTIICLHTLRKFETSNHQEFTQYQIDNLQLTGK